ncbi:hypothetical protein ACIFOC_00428 [Leucobacter aridicollis]|uniref:Uncharacterized protein n=1 Tax=Leucobacter aridicollis TaxID=283878 RepID=A0A852R0J7_9MICO|nr:hypothetical protein [Leucobacter aridicollis]MBL3682636.1 hypothetical protein [Leucobacter aridicollis]NYD26067.1 hypothetical protein [Leucobacter aridicollis]
MLRATIRLVETVELEASGASLEEVHAQLEANRPEGFDLVKAPVKMGKTGGVITAAGTYQRRDQTQVVEAATMPELNAKVPDGWQMLHVQTIP